MTASSTHCCRSRSPLSDLTPRALRALLFTLLMCVHAACSAAGGITMRELRLDSTDDGYQLSTDIAVTLSPRLAEAVTRGVALYFILEFDIRRPRWYWLDENVAERTQTYRLSYYALTRQYRVSTGALHQSFDSLEEALNLIGRLRSWPVTEHNRLKTGESYVASLRLRLDVTQLPKPFQLSAMSNRDWTLESEWERWGFTARAPEAR